MQIILYSHTSNTQKNRLQKVIAQATGQTPDLVFDFDSLFTTIKLKMSEQLILILLISSIEELDFLCSDKVRLFNSPVILILPDEEESSISKGLSLYPRYLAHSSRDFKDVTAVLNKMIQYNDSKEEKLKALKLKNISSS